MNIRWTKPCEIEIHENDDEESMVIEERQVGDIDRDVEIVDYGIRMIDGKFQEDKNLPQFQFGDGSITNCISSDWFEEWTDEDEETERLKDEKNGLYPDKIDIAN